MEKLIQYLESEKERLHGELIGTAKLLIMELNRAISDLEDPAYGRINGLGFFQGKGTQFDILCARYDDVKRHLEMIQATID